MALDVDEDKARRILRSAWENIEQAGISPAPKVLDQIQAILNARDITYKYILVTGLLGRCANPKVHPRALQAGSKLAGAYDARSLCHGVVVSFEKEIGLNLWGLSNEPFLNKPARHTEHYKQNPQLRVGSKAGISILKWPRNISSPIW